LEENKLIIITGPTASGKTALAMKIAEKENKAVISADSRQVYKYLNIGTAKPTAEEQKKIKHHLVDIITPENQYNAGKFLDDSQLIVFQHYQEQKPLPIIAGGTGLYIKSFTEGLAEIPDIPENIVHQLSKIAKSQGLDTLYEQLRQIDPEAADSIHSNDKQRIIRFLSVYLFTRKTYTSFLKIQEKPKYPFYITQILFLPDREELYEKINNRVDMMIEKGLVQEVKKILDLGFPPQSPGLRTLGYQEMISYLKNEITLDEAIELIKKNTRNFAKRQYTWFKKENYDILIENNQDLIDVEKQFSI